MSSSSEKFINLSEEEDIVMEIFSRENEENSNLQFDNPSTINTEDVGNQSSDDDAYADEEGVFIHMDGHEFHNMSKFQKFQSRKEAEEDEERLEGSFEDQNYMEAKIEEFTHRQKSESEDSEVRQRIRALQTVIKEKSQEAEDLPLQAIIPTKSEILQSVRFPIPPLDGGRQEITIAEYPEFPNGDMKVRYPVTRNPDGTSISVISTSGWVTLQVNSHAHIWKEEDNCLC